MPLMREWVEITVDEDLLIPVVRELLDMAVNPNHVEVVYGTTGRVILAEVHLAEHWYQERLKRHEAENLPKDDFQGLTQTEVLASTTIERSPDPVLAVPVQVPLTPLAPKADVEASTVAAVTVPAPAAAPAPTPAKRAPAPKPSASLNGEDS